MKLASLPFQLSYTSALITSSQHERRAVIPRRALFDVRMQIMAEYPPVKISSATTIGDAPSSTSTLENGVRLKRKKKDISGNRILHGPQAGAEIGLRDSDIERNVYEGGFKSWEGAMDLARLVLERGPRKDIDELSRVDAVFEVSLQFMSKW